MGFTIYIPRDIDLDEFNIDGVPLSAKQRDQLACILSLITLYTKSKIQAEDGDNFLLKPTGSKKMQWYVHEFKKYLDLLLNHNYIIYSNFFIPGIRANEYTLNLDVFGQDFITKPYEVTDFILERKYLAKHRETKKKDKKKYNLNNYKHLTKWFNDNLELDFDQAEEWMNEYVQDLELGNLDPIERQRKIRGYDSCLASIRHLRDHDYKFSIDSVGRFHSPLTNLVKGIRQFITYDGMRIFSVDMTNALPLLSTAFFDKYFFLPEYQNTGLVNLFNLNQAIINKTFSNLFNVQVEAEVAHCNFIILLEETLDSPDSEDYWEFINKTLTGQVYEYMIERMRVVTGREYNRDQIKRVMFLIMFCDPSEGWVATDQRILDFNNSFPTVYKVYNMIKRNDYKLLSYLLMRIESWFMIENLTRRFSAEHPNIPIFTIHDNIATTEDHSDLLQEFFEYESVEILCFEAPLKREAW